MRAKEFLFEYKRDITAQRLGSKLSQSGQREGVADVDTILSSLEEMDPTPNKQYMIWLTNQYIGGKFRLEDSPRIKELLVNFETLKSRLPEKDIGRYDLHTLETIIDQAMGVELGRPDTLTSGTFPVIPNSEVLYNGPLGQLSIPKTEEASCELGRGTKWCTSAKNDNRFAEYARKGPIYIWRDKNGEKYQFHFETVQFMDSGDRPIPHEKLLYFIRKHPVLKRLFTKEEKKYANYPSLAYKYARDVIKDRFPETEEAIAMYPKVAYEYARDVIKDRFPEAEEAIAKDPKLAYEYARDIIKGKWPEAEEAIAKDPKLAYLYARDVIKGRFPEAEKIIAKNPVGAYFYAQEVIKDRFPEAEKIIVKNPKVAYEYARDVIKDRFPEAEEAIAKDPNWAYEYARDVIKDRFPEAEEAIAKNPMWAYLYAQNVIKGRWPEAEKTIAKDPNWASWYARIGK